MAAFPEAVCEVQTVGKEKDNNDKENFAYYIVLMLVV